jgi:hypothetical protein
MTPQKYYPRQYGRVIRPATPKTVRSIPCPLCGAAAGEPCIRANGNERVSNHVDRMQDYIKNRYKKKNRKKK